MVGDACASRRGSGANRGRGTVTRIDTSHRQSGVEGDLEGALERGLDLIRRGDFFAAHEELELAWRAAHPAERDFFQGLVHVAVAWYQAGRRNRVGCERQLAKAARRLAPYAPRHRNVEVASVLECVDDARARVDAGSLALPPPTV